MSKESEIDNIKLVLVQDIHISIGLATILATTLVCKIKVGTKDRFEIQGGIGVVKPKDYDYWGNDR